LQSIATEAPLVRRYRNQLSVQRVNGVHLALMNRGHSKPSIEPMNQQCIDCHVLNEHPLRGEKVAARIASSCLAVA
jgi:hypothetical protein